MAELTKFVERLTDYGFGSHAVDWVLFAAVWAAARHVIWRRHGSICATGEEMNMYQDALMALEALRESLEDLPEAKLDTEALLRVELANHLAAAARVLSALAADEEK